MVNKLTAVFLVLLQLSCGEQEENIEVQNSIVASESSDSMRLIGGSRIGYSNSIKVSGLDPSVGFCSGTMISSHLLLTAAHCIKNPISAGSNFLIGSQKWEPLTGNYEYVVQTVVLDHIVMDKIPPESIYLDHKITAGQLKKRDFAFVFIRYGTNYNEVAEKVSWFKKSLSSTNWDTFKFITPKKGDNFFVDGWGYPAAVDNTLGYCTDSSGLRICNPTFTPIYPEDTPDITDDNLLKTADFKISRVGEEQISDVWGPTYMFVTSVNITEVAAPTVDDSRRTRLIFPSGDFGALTQGDSGSAAFATGNEMYGVFSGIDNRVDGKPKAKWWNVFSTIDNDWYMQNVWNQVVVDNIPTSMKIGYSYVIYGRLLWKAVEYSNSNSYIHTFPCNLLRSDTLGPAYADRNRARDDGLQDGYDYSCVTPVGNPGTAKNVIIRTANGSVKTKMVYPIQIYN